ncbi:unnamed protein product [Nippostrongylus brasiliensis]|uniref:Uncharacterized protein n=1 Tax=Nippostrongylus brasiliensis TaxID=27835 RepID=A0A0N4YYD7_NIPBR|nr:unnamed protein product [Nippostrongylus brasiliensis]
MILSLVASAFGQPTPQIQLTCAENAAAVHILAAIHMTGRGGMPGTPGIATSTHTMVAKRTDSSQQTSTKSHNQFTQTRLLSQDSQIETEQTSTKEAEEDLLGLAVEISDEELEIEELEIADEDNEEKERSPTPVAKVHERRQEGGVSHERERQHRPLSRRGSYAERSRSSVTQ